MDSWQDLGKEFQKLRREFRAAMPAKLTRLRSLWDRVDCDDPDREALEVLKREVHSMAGSAGTFGLPKVSEVAAAAEDALEGLKSGSRPGVKRATKFRTRLQALEKAALPPK